MAVQPRNLTPQEASKMGGSRGEENNPGLNPDISLKDFLDFLCTSYQVRYLLKLIRFISNIFSFQILYGHLFNYLIYF